MIPWKMLKSCRHEYEWSCARRRDLSGGCKRTGCPSSLWPSRLKRLRPAAPSLWWEHVDVRRERSIKECHECMNALHYHEMHERFSWMVYEKGFMKDFHEWLCERFYERFLPIGSWSLGKCLLLNGRNAFKWKKEKCLLIEFITHVLFSQPQTGTGKTKWWKKCL